MDIGKSLKLALIHQGKTQSEIAASMGVSRAYVSAIANNEKTLSLSKLSFMSSIIGMPVSEFIALGEA